MHACTHYKCFGKGGRRWEHSQLPRGLAKGLPRGRAKRLPA